MVFNCFNFWLIFPFIFFGYWSIPSKCNNLRKVFLLAVSYLLYMNWKPAFALVLLGVTAITYIGGYYIGADTKKNKKILCWCFAVLGLLPLLVFKYYNFLNDSITTGLEAVGMHLVLPGLNWAIPIGISFYSFQAVGYVLDVYHKRVSAEQNLLNYALFVSFFPQITSGPISTAKDLISQIKTPHSFCYEQGRDGMKMVLWGMFLKLALADRIGIYVDTIYSNYIHYSGAVCFFASIMYTIQIYCDFAGYSLLAIGIAKMLGFDFINNFERPYLAASVTEFWKRWHISLTKWLTTHVYINLGGNRCGKFRQYLNIMITFLVSGLWHGANWTFVIWGALHGLFQIVEKMLFGDKLKTETKPNSCTSKTVRFFRILITFNLVSFAWIFFRIPTLKDSLFLIGRIFMEFGSFSIAPLDIVSVLCLAVCLPMLILKDTMDEYVPNLITKRIVKWVFYLFVAVCTLTLGVLDSGQFIYVNF